MKITRFIEDYRWNNGYAEYEIEDIIIDDVRLEHSPKVLATVIGKLISTLWDKGMLKDDEVKNILGINYEYPPYALKGNNETV